MPTCRQLLSPTGLPPLHLRHLFRYHRWRRPLGPPSLRLRIRYHHQPFPRHLLGRPRPSLRWHCRPCLRWRGCQHFHRSHQSQSFHRIRRCPDGYCSRRQKHTERSLTERHFDTSNWNLACLSSHRGGGPRSLPGPSASAQRCLSRFEDGTRTATKEPSTTHQRRHRGFAHWLPFRNELPQRRSTHLTCLGRPDSYEEILRIFDGPTVPLNVSHREPGAMISARKLIASAAALASLFRLI
jgi:hypothetical protein